MASFLCVDTWPYGDKTGERTTEEDGLVFWSGPQRFLDADKRTIEREGKGKFYGRFVTVN